MLKGGVFGFGHVGQTMTRRINSEGWCGDDVQIVAACNRGKAKRDIAEKDFGLAAYETLDGLIGHDLDFILLVSNSQAHHESAVKCARAGIPFLIEKPLALTLGDAEDIVAETNKAGVINGVNYSLRYFPIHRKLKQLVDSGELGDLISIWAQMFRGHGWYAAGKRHRAVVEPEESGGWIVHHMCHIVDWAIWLAGEVDEVYTLTKSTAPAELDSEEAVYSTIKFKNGAIGTLSDEVGSAYGDTYGLSGTKAGIREMTDTVKPLLKLKYETDIEWAEPHVIDPTNAFEPDDGLKHFIRRLKAGKPTDVPVDEACYSLKVCFAMRESAKTGKPVKIEG